MIWILSEKAKFFCFFSKFMSNQSQMKRVDLAERTLLNKPLNEMKTDSPNQTKQKRLLGSTLLQKVIFSLKDFLFHHSFLTPQNIYNPLKNNQKSKNRPLKFDLEKCPGSNRIVPCSNRLKIAVESLKINFFRIFKNYKVEHHKGYNFCKNNFFKFSL